MLVYLVGITVLFSVLGYFGRNYWLLDLFSHFKVQYFIVITVGTIILFFKRKKIAYIFIPFIVALLLEISPLYFGSKKNDNLTSSTKIICINLLSSNRKFEDVVRYISEKSPDIIVLQEFTHSWQSMLEPKFQEYQYRYTIPREDNFGMTIYSRINVAVFEELKIGNAGLPSIRADFLLGNTQVSLITTHPFPPIGADNFVSRNVQLSALGKLVAALENEVIVIGDLNTSSFSIHFKQLIADSQLVDSRKGFGLLTTWPTWFSPARITLDHCLVSRGISVNSRVVGDDIGSDHLPIFVEFKVDQD